MYYLYKFQTEEELTLAIEKYIDFYNNGRPQGRYHDLTPTEVREAALNIKSDIEQYSIEENKRVQKYYQALEAKQARKAVA